MSERIFKQTNIITNPVADELMIEGFRSQLSSRIFNELINGEKFGLFVTFTIDVIETEDELDSVLVDTQGSK